MRKYHTNEGRKKFTLASSLILIQDWLLKSTSTAIQMPTSKELFSTINQFVIIVEKLTAIGKLIEVWFSDVGDIDIVQFRHSPIFMCVPVNWPEFRNINLIGSVVIGSPGDLTTNHGSWIMHQWSGTSNHVSFSFFHRRKSCPCSSLDVCRSNISNIHAPSSFMWLMALIRKRHLTDSECNFKRINPPLVLRA